MTRGGTEKRESECEDHLLPGCGCQQVLFLKSECLSLWNGLKIFPASSSRILIDSLRQNSRLRRSRMFIESLTQKFPGSAGAECFLMPPTRINIWLLRSQFLLGRVTINTWLQIGRASCRSRV